MSNCVLVVEDNFRAQHIECGLRNAGYTVHVVKADTINELNRYVHEYHPAYIVIEDEVIVDFSTLENGLPLH